MCPSGKEPTGGICEKPGRRSEEPSVSHIGADQHDRFSLACSLKALTLTAFHQAAASRYVPWY